MRDCASEIRAHKPAMNLHEIVAEAQRAEADGFAFYVVPSKP